MSSRRALYCCSPACSTNAHVYVARAHSGRPLYVGVTWDLEKRLANHRCRSEWWDLADSIETESFTCRWRAENREADLIEDLQPTFNIESPPNLEYQRESAATQATFRELLSRWIDEMERRAARAEVSA